ncbi:hypothetical protein QVD17_36201 [Tagetes erecta]|uniref:Uncharacterized protein n=1 Tax=Tagetes erecta TaxID=13708 RepID=A0AAD8JS88_TARER|nr:hypothetical protein QVD17_36201 [Tagetes erecta]
MKQKILPSEIQAFIGIPLELNVNIKPNGALGVEASSLLGNCQPSHSLLLTPRTMLTRGLQLHIHAKVKTNNRSRLQD